MTNATITNAQRINDQIDNERWIKTNKKTPNTNETTAQLDEPKSIISEVPLSPS